MEPIIELPDGLDIPFGDGMRLVRVEYENGGEVLEDVTVFDRVAWRERDGNDWMWQRCAAQQINGSDISDEDGERVVVVELPEWWARKDAEDADSGEPTWNSAYGPVLSDQRVLAVVDYGWSADGAAWSFPAIRSQDGNWKTPGHYGVGGPKSVLPVIFPVGQPDRGDALEIYTRDARQAARKNDDAEQYDWEAAIERAEARARRQAEMVDGELDITAIGTLEEQHIKAGTAAKGAFLDMKDRLDNELGTEPDPVTLTHASEAIAQAVRDVQDIEDPRE